MKINRKLLAEWLMSKSYSEFIDFNAIEIFCKEHGENVDNKIIDIAVEDNNKFEVEK